ncbi:MAG: hypothetical protein JHC95_18430 [Solirubrobacteraceae bacterium]|nr:hypothetical protein [Solirubrobacteraceae bacterium]
MLLRIARAGVLIGASLFVVGAWIGWYEPPFPGLPRSPAYEFAGPVGEWAWLGVAPLLAACVAPFTRPWLRWLWLTPVPPLVAVAIVATVDPFSLVVFPFSPPFSERSAWLLVSGAGAALAWAALVVAWWWTRHGAEQTSRRWQPIAALAMIVLVAIAVPALRGPRNLEAERVAARGGADECEPSSRLDEVRVECRDRLGREPRCAVEVRCHDGSRSGQTGGYDTAP